MKELPYILLIVHFQAWTIGKHKVCVRSSLIRWRLVQWSSSDKLFSREEHESTRLNDYALLEGPYSTWYILDGIQLTTIGTVHCTIEPVVDLQSWSFIETLTLNKQWKTTNTMLRDTLYLFIRTHYARYSICPSQQNICTRQGNYTS